MSSFTQLIVRGIGVLAVIGASLLVLERPTPGDPASKDSLNLNQGTASLALSSTELNFGRVEHGEAESAIVTLSHIGPTGSGAIVIDNLFLDELDSLHYSLNTTGPIELAPSESFDLLVGFEPANFGALPGRLILNHNGSAGVDIIDLNGEGFDSNAPVLSAANPPSLPFGKSLLKGFQSGGKPTSLQFGPDGRLYVAFMDGDIHVLDIERLGENNYKITDVDAITSVKNITNHNDNGSKQQWLKKRLVTGLLVTGTAATPVIYVHSSDPRIGGGNSGNTTGLDTNSGVLSRLTKTSNGWQKLDLVRGLPRSEENHHTNGMALVGSTLYIAAGGNTNMGAMSNNFAMLPEYALSAAILSVDLDQIGNTTYDLPTLDDENRPGVSDFNDPFGGNGGKNQAMLVPGGPVQVYAPGFRNPYDVVVMQNGKMYSWDNGPNSGWGGAPSNCSNARKEPGNTQHDALHLITGAGYYAGHPNPTRGSTQNKFNNSNPQSPVPYSNSIECNYYGPGTNGNGKHQKNKSLISLPRSTNGMAEYTASNLSGAITGDLLAVSWDNKIYRVSFKPSGALDDMNVLFSNVGTSPLDITAQSDNAVFPGTIWVADLQSKNIVVYEPDDFDGSGSGGGCVVGNGNGDADEDGFADYDEIANGTDGCSAADFPADADGDFISDLIDTDDDNDNMADVVDPFALDATNGAGTNLPIDYQWENDSSDPGFIARLGFSGLMTNGVDNYQSLYDLNEMTIIGAAGVLTIDSVPAGDPLRQKNSQQYGFQFGVNVGPSSPVFRAHTRVLAPFSGFVPKLHQSMGLFIGTGDQDNYVKLTIKHNVIQLLSEVEGKTYFEQNQSLSFVDTDYVDLIIEVDPASAIATAFFKITTDDQTQAEVQLASVDFPAMWLSNSTKLAVGIISTSIGASPFPATWDFMTVKPVDAGVLNAAPSVTIPAIAEVSVDTATIISATVTDDGLPGDTLSTLWSTVSGPAAVTFDDATSISTSVTFSAAGSYLLQLSATDGQLSSTDTVVVVVSDGSDNQSNIVYRINAGGPLISSDDGDWQSDSAASQYVNTGKTWKSTAPVTTGGISTGAPAGMFNTERYDVASGPALEWKLPVTPGEYVVRLYFSENYFGAMSVGGRVFDVDVEGQLLSGIDVFASVGANNAMMKSFTVQSDSELNIKFSHVTQNPAIKGIEVLKGGVMTTENMPPVVSAGADRDTLVDLAVSLTGTVSDDGLPAGSITSTWSVLSGPSAAQFTDTGSTSTQVTFPVAGVYILRLLADDGELTASDDIQIEVKPPEVVLNTAPVVAAGTDTTTTPGATVNLFGTVSDDGLPSNTISANWSVRSGPSGVQFANASAANTTATFATVGDYVLRLSASDSVLSSFDEVVITIEDEPVVASVIYRINAGGPAIADVNGDWAADNNGSSLANTGNTYSKGVTINTTSAPGIPAKLFQSERWDPKSGAEMHWKLPVTPGQYDVYLYFAEIYNGAMGEGKRIFNVSVEGQGVGMLDVYGESGENTALVKSFSVDNSDGIIDILFDHVVENPAVKGIEVIAR